MSKLTVHDTPEENGVSESYNKKAMQYVRAMLYDASLPQNLWGEAVMHANWLLNRTATSALDGMTPYEARKGVKPDLSNLPVWGARVWVHDPDGSKLAPRAKEGRWVGFDPNSQGHRIYWKKTRSVTVERSVRFSRLATFPELEGERVSLDELREVRGSDNEADEGGVNERNAPSGDGVAEKSASPDDDASEKSVSSEAEKSKADDAEVPGVPSESVDDSPVAEIPIPEPEDDVEAPEVPAARLQRARKPTTAVRDILDGVGSTDGRPSRPMFPHGFQPPDAARLADDKFALMIEVRLDDAGGVEWAMAASVAELEGLEPRSIEEARKRPDWPRWKEAIDDELKGLVENGTWELVDCPAGVNVVGCRFVFAIKKNAAGAIERYKARLVAQGYTQVPGVDYFDTFSPVAKLASLRLMLAMAARYDWDVEQMDVKQAYLKALLTEVIYMRQPPGFAVPGQEKKVLQLKKALYGLKQSGRAWYEMMCAILKGFGFTRSEVDHAVFHRRVGTTDVVIIAAHVDDLTIVASTKASMTETKRQLRSKLEMTDLGEIHWLLGIEIRRDRERRTISLAALVHQVHARTLQHERREACLDTDGPVVCPLQVPVPIYCRRVCGDARCALSRGCRRRGIRSYWYAS